MTPPHYIDYELWGSFLIRSQTNTGCDMHFIKIYPPRGAHYTQGCKINIATSIPPGGKLTTGVDTPFIVILPLPMRAHYTQGCKIHIATLIPRGKNLQPVDMPFITTYPHVGRIVHKGAKYILLP